MNFHKKPVKATKDLPIVIVAWIDSVLDPAHEVDLKDDTSHFGGLLEREDIGFLVKSDKKEVVLALSRCHSDNTVSYSNTIPRNWVRSITFLEEKPSETPFTTTPPPLPLEIPSGGHFDGAEPAPSLQKRASKGD